MFHLSAKCHHLSVPSETTNHCWERSVWWSDSEHFIRVMEKWLRSKYLQSHVRNTHQITINTQWQCEQCLCETIQPYIKTHDSNQMAKCKQLTMFSWLKGSFPSRDTEHVPPHYFIRSSGLKHTNNSSFRALIHSDLFSATCLLLVTHHELSQHVRRRLLHHEIFLNRVCQEMRINRCCPLQPMSCVKEKKAWSKSFFCSVGREASRVCVAERKAGLLSPVLLGCTHCP